jgi:hypothetical protein
MATADQGGGDPSRLRGALLGALRPLAAMLLRFGIGYREFAEVAKAAFVDAATAEFGVRGRPTNTSRVAAMTGLTRKEVRRIRAAHYEVLESGPGTVPADVLHRWFTDPRYAQAPGSPRDLGFEGPEPSFATLVRECAADLPPGAVRAELRRIGALEETPAGVLRATRRHAIPASALEALLEGITTGLRPVTMTVDWNAAAAPGVPRRFQRAVTNRQVPAARRAEVEAVLRQRLTAWTEEVDDYLAGVEAGRADQAGAALPEAILGVGMYYFEEHRAAGGEPRAGGTDR